MGAVSSAVASGAGGVILFGSTAPADLGSQIAAIEAAVPGRLGLLVMTDEEGGGVQRMANLVGSLPWASYMGANWTPAEITAQVAAVARGMAQYGVNMDLAPVVDVDGRNVPPGPTDPDGWRSFSGSTSVVTADGIAYMSGLEEGGVIPVLKHFPGLGGASGNTDNGTATTLPWMTLQTVGLPPFTAAIQDGAITIFSRDAEGVSNYRTVEELMEALDPDVFWRPHRSYLVNINHIKEVVPWFKSSYMLKMDDKRASEIPVSRNQTRRLRELLKL